VLITGASSGLGRATAEALARSGHKVFGTARAPERTQAIPGVPLLPLDVTDDASVKRGVQSVLDAVGHIDVLINNAGYSVLGAFEETSIDQAKALFDTNVFGVMRMSQAVLPSMRAQGSGMIVNVSSVLGFLPAPYQALYSSTKHALEGLSESLDHEVRQFGVRVMLIEPNYTRTGLGTHSVAAAAVMPAYDSERGRASAAVTASIQAAAEPGVVAQEIVRAIGAPYRLRRPVGPGAKLLSRLRRFMPAGPVDKQLRRTFALDA
jgi:short-subunit dehydrogenase